MAKPKQAAAVAGTAPATESAPAKVTISLLSDDGKPACATEASRTDLYAQPSPSRPESRKKEATKEGRKCEVRKCEVPLLVFTSGSRPARDAASEILGVCSVIEWRSLRFYQAPRAIAVGRAPCSDRLSSCDEPSQGGEASSCIFRSW